MDISTIFDSLTQNTAKKTAESVVNAVLTPIVERVKKEMGRAKVELGTAFEFYLQNATMRYNRIHTIASGADPRPIIGEGSIYENIYLKHGGAEIDTATVEEVLKLGNHILILGTGGAGKSLLMRYLFLEAMQEKEYVPVLVELRRVNDQAPGGINVMNIIHNSLLDFDAILPDDQFEYSLRNGKHLLLFDGFDEVRDELAVEIAQGIHDFCNKYPLNPCIVSSRPVGNDTLPLDTFVTVETVPLKREQSVNYASKLWPEDENTREFCRQLDETLYDKYTDFAQNPLLLSMMFLTFMQNGAIPEHLADFNDKCYEALYSAHDLKDKGYFRRAFSCKNIDENTFKLVFAHFCFQTYFKDKQALTEQETIQFLNRSFQKYKQDAKSVADYLNDLCEAVCLIKRDNGICRFTHNAFQAYFAAFYTSRAILDEQQVKLFATQLSSATDTWRRNGEYYQLLLQIEPERFAANALTNGIKKLIRQAESSDDIAEYLLRAVSTGVYFSEGVLTLSSDGRNNYNYNVFTLFEEYAAFTGRNIGLPKDYDRGRNAAEAKKYIEQVPVNPKSEGITKYTAIDAAKTLTDFERKALYDIIKKDSLLMECYRAMRLWLREQDKKQKAMKSKAFIEEL